MLYSSVFIASLLGAAAALPATHTSWPTSKATPTKWTTTEATPTTWAPGEGGHGGFQPTGTTIDANFDNLSALPVPTATIGPYDYLDFQGLDVAQQGVAGVQVAGVKPHSPPNVAVSDPLIELEDGKPTITADTTPYFDFLSFYFGCVDFNANSLTSIPLPCNATVTGYWEDKQIASQTFSFVPDNDVLSDPTLAKLDADFKHLDKVEIDYVLNENLLNSTLLADLPVIAYISDDYTYVVYKNKTGHGQNWES